ncbi:hypothetical protein NDU88_006985 [Pleurodeles waltl]|uniref:Uncharacterized protein n=1 Tax=Pleurodeles waltl TaxID=8319 RepID=A0AAV7TZC7_PLEWA|nr:hypothetical protein NDU88_006985 [Pleurodeles waltl]
MEPLPLRTRQRIHNVIVDSRHVTHPEINIAAQTVQYKNAQQLKNLYVSSRLTIYHQNNGKIVHPKQHSFVRQKVTPNPNRHQQRKELQKGDATLPDCHASGQSSAQNFQSQYRPKPNAPDVSEKIWKSQSHNGHG